MKDFCIVGSGISGSTIAKLLSDKYTLEIFDKAKGVGGRSSNRRYKKKLSFDHGLQYISPQDINFKKHIINLKRKNIVKIWGGNHLDFNFKKNKSIKYIGVKGNNEISRYFLKGLKINLSSTITKINFKSNYWEITLNKKKKLYFKNLILTCPFPQTKKLARKYIGKKIKVNMLPSITVMVVYKNLANLPISSMKINDNILAWASNENSKKRFKSNLQLWTLQTNTKFAKKFINNFKTKKKLISNLVIKRFSNLIGFKMKNCISVNTHYWKYSYSLKDTYLKSLWFNKFNLGLCGDWFLGNKAEHAWISSNNLQKKIHKKKPA